MTYEQLETLRERRGLDKHDSSQDAAIIVMSPIAMLEEITAWKLGDNYWTYWFKKQCEGLKINWVNEQGERL
jgi:hypothetical protein